MNQNESEFREERPAGTGDLPREIEPPRDLWTGIAERIRAEGRVDAPLPARRRPIPGRFDAWRRPLLAAAALALAFFAGYGTRDLRIPGGARTDGPAVAGTAETPQTTETAVAALERGEAPDAGADAVVAALSERRDELDPATVEVLLRNLTILDEASREIRDALEKDPGNTRLEGMLSDGDERRGAVIRRAASLLKVI